MRTNATSGLMDWADWLVLILGVILIVSPFALGFSEDITAEWWDISIGVALIVISLLRLVSPGKSKTE